jgi:sarcosine oxidase, subunit gamma
VDKTLKPLTALGRVAPQVTVIGPWRMAERADVAIASVAVRRGGDLAPAALAAGIPLPGPARAKAGAVYAAFWVTPEMWFVTAPFASHEDIAARLKTVFGAAASVTEQTDAWVRIDLTAPDLTPLLERLTNVDFATAPAGFASRTLIDHLGCYLIKSLV